MKRTPARKKKSVRAPIPVFVATTIVVFFLTLSAADSIGFVPDYIDGSSPTNASQDGTDLASSESISLTDLPELGVTDQSARGGISTPLPAGAFPVRITIQSVSINLPVQNPSTTDVDALDALLVKGPARYAPSAKLGQEGNMIIFAHSSHLPIVHNKMYQAFNGIPDVSPGATISILGSDGKSYIYSANSVVRADAGSGTTIPLTAAGGAKLTLVTCDTLTGKSARYILTADFIGTN